MLNRLQNSLCNNHTDFTDNTEGYEILMEDFDLIQTQTPSKTQSSSATAKSSKINNKSVILQALDTLIKDEPSIKRGTEVHICPFRIVKDSPTPFLIYGLYRDDSNILRWPSLQYVGGLCSHIAISTLTNIYGAQNTALAYKGYRRDHSGIQIWIECDSNNYTLETGDLKTRMWWVLISEILNQRKCLHFTIQPAVSHFFLNHPLFLYLHDEEEHIIETPVVGYIGDYYKRIVSIAAMGKEREDALSCVGAFYKFGSYSSAMHDAFWSPNYLPVKVNKEYITKGSLGRYTKGGLVRFALFLKRHTMYEGNILKNWHVHYDSISDGFDIILTHFNQQKPLSYHAIDTSQRVVPSNINTATISSF
tara:strand:+ start:274 stop:1362 length:1089 start_codon:yes stop_codon:yes gene_type:complete